MNDNGILFILSGPSGIGKNTVINELRTKLGGRLFHSISYTTRSPRNKEVNGTDYYFISKEEFAKKIKDDAFLEYADYVNEWYGTPKKPVIDNLAQGKFVVLDIEVDGALKIIKSYKDCISCFLFPDDIELLRYRLTKRGDVSLDKIEKRINEYHIERVMFDKYNFCLCGDDAVKNAEQILMLVDLEIKYRKD